MRANQFVTRSLLIACVLTMGIGCGNGSGMSTDSNDGNARDEPTDQPGHSQQVSKPEQWGSLMINPPGSTNCNAKCKESGAVCGIPPGQHCGGDETDCPWFRGSRAIYDNCIVQFDCDVVPPPSYTCESKQEVPLKTQECGCLLW